MKPTRLIILFSIELILSSCKKDQKAKEESADICFPLISGFTGTDDLAQYTGPMDTTDWKLMDGWNQCEKNLFGGTNYDLNCSFIDTFSLFGVVGFPNPTSNTFGIGFNGFAIGSTDSTTQVELVILNQDHHNFFQVQEDIQHIQNYLFSLNLMDSVLTDTIFRVYYKLTDINNCVRMGHGDIIRR